MKRFAGMTLLYCVIAVSAYAVDGQEPQRRESAAEEGQRAVSREGVEYLERLRKGTPFGTTEFNLLALRAGMGTRNEPKIEGVRLIRSKIGDVPCEWVLAPGADPDLRLLYLHGGGWVSGSGGNYLPLAADISAAAKCAVLLPDYRLAPEHRFPAGLEDCIAAHDWLIANGPSGPGPAKATFIAGDSAGGNLTLATLLALRDRKRPLPTGGIALSAATDFTLASESLKSVHDPIISARTMPEFRDRYLEKADPNNPLASPVFGDFHGIPPLLIQVGEHEMLRDDSLRVAKKAQSDGISVKLEVWPGMVHVFQIRGLPESREAIEHIAEFMRSQLAIPQAQDAEARLNQSLAAEGSTKAPLVVFLVRHAEKVDSSRDPELSAAGTERADELASVLRDANVKHIHSSDFIRTRNTAAPIAARLDLNVELYDPNDLPTFIGKLRQVGGRHLVVGHSTSTPAAVELLGGKPGANINESGEFDRLYIVTVDASGEASTVLIRYGRPFKEAGVESALHP